jgi:hypothetical protein
LLYISSSHQTIHKSQCCGELTTELVYRYEVSRKDAKLNIFFFVAPQRLCERSITV